MKIVGNKADAVFEIQFGFYQMNRLRLLDFRGNEIKKRKKGAGMAICAIVSTVILIGMFFRSIVVTRLFFFSLAAAVFLFFLFAALLCLLSKQHLFWKDKRPQTQHNQK
ncbi:hypothetical protein [Chryseobacterium sp. R2A-55]|uniref:hypothetical protein n=1 Tax=Chryseobacterium sp. R2A-55 TaxID=2744445 RepID=UPI001F36C786|nr:hypothetical protein [Chryseobacterium sp. R2A-55]